jgi:hypothetical protein
VFLNKNKNLDRMKTISCVMQASMYEVTKEMGTYLSGTLPLKNEHQLLVNNAGAALAQICNFFPLLSLFCLFLIIISYGPLL